MIPSPAACACGMHPDGLPTSTPSPTMINVPGFIPACPLCLCWWRPALHGTEPRHAILRIDGFPLSLRAVHSPEQVGEMFGVDGRHFPDRVARSVGLLHLSVEGTVLDGCTDVEHADVDAFLGYLGMQGLQVVALGGLCGTRAAHVRQAPHGAAALRGQ